MLKSSSETVPLPIPMDMVSRHWWPRGTYSSSPEIVCAVFAAEELIEESTSFEARPKCRTPPVRIRHATKDLADVLERLIPANRFVGVAGTIINQRLVRRP